MAAERRLQMALHAARAAGAAILPWYGTDLAATRKHDGSPLTEADNAAHAVLVSILSSSDLPVVSEEGESLHLGAPKYWLVDPLDGTKEFLASNDEFTVNVALVEDGQPVLGVVYAPALGEVYAAARGDTVWCERHGRRVPCETPSRSDRLRMATSRFHDDPDTELFARANDVAERVTIGSALKYGRLATGDVDVYPRLQGTSEWDTAAGQAVLEAAGGGIFDWHTGEPVRYGKVKRRNGRFLAVRTPYTASDFHRRHYEPSLL